MGHCFGWLGVSGGVWGIILGWWGQVGHYFGWVGVGGQICWVGGDEWE